MIVTPRDYLQPLPKQTEFLENVLLDDTVRYTWYVGGFGSMASTSQILTIKDGKIVTKTIEELYKKREINTVLSWSGKNFVWQNATPPIKEGNCEMFEVSTENRTVVVNMSHRFLTPNGYKELKDLNIGDSIFCLPFSSDESLLTAPYGFDDVVLLSEQPSYQDGCSMGFRQYDGHPHSIQFGDQSSPKQFFYIKNNSYHESFCFLHFSHDLRKNYLQPALSYILRKLGVFPYSYTKESSSVHSSVQYQESFQSQQKYNRLQVHKYNDNDFRSNYKYLSHNPFLHLLERVKLFVGNIPTLLRCLFVSSLQNKDVLYPHSNDSFDVSYKNKKNKEHTILPKEEKIVNIKSVGHMDYYDMHVPRYNNFVANGIIHHNSGKSTVGCIAAIELSMMNEKNRGLIARSKFIDLKATTMQTMKELIEKLHLEVLLLGDSWDNAFSSDNSLLKFKNGSEIYFWGLDYRSDEQLKSLELGWFYLDEVNEIPESAFTVLRGRLRRPNVSRRVGFITSNPEGQNWTYQYFVNHTVRDIEGQKRTRMKEQDIGKFKYIVAPSTENTHLPEEYLDTLEGYQGIAYRRYVKGEFATYAGIVYDQIEPSVHYIPRFEVPREWYDYGINGALDYGMTNPTAVGKFAISPHDGSIILTDMFYKANSTIEQNAPLIRKMFGKYETDTLYLYADPSTFNKNQEATGNELNKANAISIADRYWEYKIRFLPAKNAVIAGIEAVKSYLSLKSERKHIISGISPAPTLYIFDDLREIIDELSVYRWNPEVPDTVMKKDDHACLTGDSRILMANGIMRRIKDVEKGDFVQTPEGEAEVVECKKTRISKIIKTTLNNGEAIFSTPDHKVYINNGDITTVDLLRYSDKIDSLFDKEKNKWKKQLSSITQDITGMANIIVQLGGVSMVKKDYIMQFGNFIMGKYQKEVISTTLTGIQETTELITLALWEAKNIYHSILIKTGVRGSIGKKLEKILIKLDHLLLRGIEAQKEKSGIVKWLKRHGKKERRYVKYAKYVVKNMKHIDQKFQNFAIRTVKQQHFGEEEVYNLTVDNEHCYYSSGVLHKNCDMLRYFIATSPLTAKTEKDIPQGSETVSDIIKKQLKRISKEVTYGQNNSYDRDNTNSAFYL